jgi:exodeoxyribonuclease V alpha subunit
VLLALGEDRPAWLDALARSPDPLVVEASRLGNYMTQWAMSIHKSQGSEFGHVVITLPPPPSRILTRELLYTAVTRAKKEVTIVASEDAIRCAVERPVARASGLAARLADG